MVERAFSRRIAMLRLPSPRFAACSNWLTGVALSALVALVAGSLGANDSAPPAAAASSPAPPAAAKSAERLREGSKLTDVSGSFEFAGDRVAFVPDGSNDSLRVLENLALERVSRLLTEGRGSRSWVVSGVLTEFRGANFLLVTKATVKLEAGPRAAP
jgi:hypothetical protein